MNKVVIIGRFTRDPEIKYSTGENATATARFSLAVNRRFKNKEGNYDADFINCVAFGKTAEFIEKYFTKGMAIGITGRIQTGSYINKEGQKVYTADVVVEETEFVESKNKGTSDNVPNNNANSNSDFEETVSDDEMPF